MVFVSLDPAAAGRFSSISPPAFDTFPFSLLSSNIIKQIFNVDRRESNEVLLPLLSLSVSLLYTSLDPPPPLFFQILIDTHATIHRASDPPTPFPPPLSLPFPPDKKLPSTTTLLSILPCLEAEREEIFSRFWRPSCGWLELSLMMRPPTERREREREKRGNSASFLEGRKRERERRLRLSQDVCVCLQNRKTPRMPQLMSCGRCCCFPSMCWRLYVHDAVR